MIHHPDDPFEKEPTMTTLTRTFTASEFSGLANCFPKATNLAKSNRQAIEGSTAAECEWDERERTLTISYDVEDTDPEYEDAGDDEATVASVVEALHALESDPVLDEDDYSERDRETYDAFLHEAAPDILRALADIFDVESVEAPDDDATRNDDAFDLLRVLFDDAHREYVWDAWYDNMTTYDAPDGTYADCSFERLARAMIDRGELTFDLLVAKGFEITAHPAMPGCVAHTANVLDQLAAFALTSTRWPIVHFDGEGAAYVTDGHTILRARLLAFGPFSGNFSPKSAANAAKALRDLAPRSKDHSLLRQVLAPLCIGTTAFPPVKNLPLDKGPSGFGKPIGINPAYLARVAHVYAETFHAPGLAMHPTGGALDAMRFDQADECYQLTALVMPLRLI